MDVLQLKQLLPLLSGLWWPFCRSLAMLSAGPLLGERMVPVTVRVLLALVLAVVLVPISQKTALSVPPMSLEAVVVTAEQGLLGLVLGLAFHLAFSAIALLGFLLTSQLGLAMAVMNDPMNGSSSDVISGLLSVLCILVFFSIDGHLLLIGVLGGSFKAWPVGSGLGLLNMSALVDAVAWVFSAALLLALPVIFSTLVVQIGMGFLNRVAPSLNLFSLGFSLVTLFGLAMLVLVLRHVPEHYQQMTQKVLTLIEQGLPTHATGAPHG